MKNLLISEYRKLVTTRMWWILLIVMIAYMGFTAAAMAAITTMPELSGQQGAPTVTASGTPSIVYTTAASMGYVFPVIIGTLSFASEYRHRTISTTYLGTPARLKVLAAKLASAIPMGLLYGIAGTGACVILGGIVLGATGGDAMLTSASTWSIILRSVLAMTLWLLVGVALGSWLTNQTVAIVAILVFTQFIEPLARIGLGATSWGADVSKFLPGAAGDSLAGGSFYSALSSTGATLPAWLGAAVLVAYALFFAALGAATTLRKDVN